MGYTEDSIKRFADSIGVESYDKSYSDTGEPMIQCVFKFSLLNKKNPTGSSLYAAIFKFGIENKCTTGAFMFGSKNELEQIVRTMNSDQNYTKISDKFGWKYNLYPFDLTINQNDGGFTAIYNWKNKPKP